MKTEELLVARIEELAEKNERLKQQKQELLVLIESVVEELKQARYCIEDGDCALEAGPNWMFDIQESIEEKLNDFKKTEGEQKWIRK